ncbi:YbjN domain-containing protein [Pleurocapsales cyanobacterium LEGE 10410]|nr:YbjN domain-containing protein [Pleurocapsales cyanobacterium LEGE 10410]
MTATITSNKQYTFYTADNSIVINNPELELERHGIKLLRCRLSFQLNYETYIYVVQHGLLNLKQEVRGSLEREEFNTDLDISIEAELKPSLLPQLAKIGSSEAAISEYLNSFKLKEGQSLEDSIASTENWYCLTIQQEDIYYRTLWHHANPTTIDRAASSTGEALQGIIVFLQEAIESYQDSPEISNSNQKLNQELIKLFNREDAIQTRPVSEVMLDFFVEDNWDYYWWEEGETLQLQCQVKNGRLTCYARAIDDKEQFVFYALCPLTAPEDKRNKIARFITRVNYGMAIGNFELDFDDGEIRYKTSIDVEGDRLSVALIKQAVYLNILTMDRYLPAIAVLIEGETSVEEAIAQI